MRDRRFDRQFVAIEDPEFVLMQHNADDHRPASSMAAARNRRGSSGGRSARCTAASFSLMTGVGSFAGARASCATPVATVRQAIGNGVLTADGIGIRSRVVFDPPKMRRLQHGCNRRWRQWALLAAAVGCGAVSADIQGPTGSDKGGKRDKTRETPSEAIRRATEIPTPKDATVRVLRGRPTEIVLEATAALRQPVEFRLGDQPRAGSLSPLRPAADSSERAVVVYTASPESATRTDSFTFRVKHRSTPTSGSATVRIEISEPRADLAVPAQIDFGEVLVGESAVRPLSIVNRGNGPYTGRLDLAPPWRLIQPTPDIELAPGERTEVSLSFSPLRPGAESFMLNYAGQASLKTTLVALPGRR